MKGKLPVHSLLDTPLWNKAAWLGMFYVHHADDDIPPFMGFAFEDADSGRQIFRAWQKYFDGADDVYDELRTVIVEGDVPGEDPGYSVIVSANPQSSISRFGISGTPAEFLVESRVHRMNPAPSSIFLSQFKSDFLRVGRFLLIPGVFTATGVRPFVAEGIGKHNVLFRHISEIRKGGDDPDAIVFSRPRESRRHSH